MTHPTQQHKMLVSSVLKVVQERSRVSPAIRSRVPPSQKFFIIIDPKMASFSAFWVVFYVIWSYKRVNNRLGIDPANQRVPGLRPWRPGPTLSPASPAPIYFSNQLQHKLYVQLDRNPDILIHSPVLQLSSSAFRILFHTHTSRLSQGIICIKLGNTHINTIWNGHFPSESGLAGCTLICFSIDSSTTYPLGTGPNASYPPWHSSTILVRRLLCLVPSTSIIPTSLWMMTSQALPLTQPVTLALILTWLIMM